MSTSPRNKITKWHNILTTLRKYCSRDKYVTGGVYADYIVEA